MSYVRRCTVPITMAGTSGTFLTPRILCGPILAVKYTKGTFADGVDFTITTKDTGQTVWTETDVNASKTVRPRALLQSTAGADLTAIYDFVYACGEVVSIAIAQAVAGQTGTFDIWWLEGDQVN